jgi:hypothetical protein
MVLFIYMNILTDQNKFIRFKNQQTINIWDENGN